MKLITSIPPRRDGTVNVAGLDGKNYKFERNADGELSGDIEHQPTVAFLLAGGLFYPSDAADYDDAIGLTAESSADDAIDDYSDGEGTGMPIEANTQPAPARARPGPKPGAKAAAK